MRLTLVQEAQAASVVLVCDGNGQIKRIIRDTIGLDEILIEGKPLCEVTESASAAPARAFIEAARLGEPIEEWQLDFSVFARKVTLSFVGCAVRFNHLLIVAANSRAALIRSCEELLECDCSPDFPESALNQFLAAMRSEPAAHKPFSDNTRLYGQLVTMQRELNQRGIELSRAAEERNRLYAAVAHDLRSPLAAITGYADLMLDGDALRPEAHESLDRIKASSGFAIDLIDSLLDLSAIESARLELKKRPIRLSEVISGSLAMNEIFARRRGVRLDAALPDDLRPVCLDPTRITQAFNYLLANAIKYSPGGGVVRVSLEQSPSLATVSISDQGPGISHARLVRMLSSAPLQRVGAPQARKPSSIGFAICRKAIKAHGGRLEVQSETGHGSTFKVVLPLATPRHSHAAHANHPPPAAH